MKNKYLVPSIRITFIYFIFSASWIFLSDYFLLMIFEDINQYRNYSTIKGLLFVLVSSLIIYNLIKREIRLIKMASMDITLLKEYDMLTNTHNRLAFSSKLDELHKNQKKVSILIADVNGLKYINEHYSVKQGDQVLISLSTLLKEELPLSTLLYRIGGDEFCAIIENCEYLEIEQYSLSILSAFNQRKSSFECSISIGYASNCNETHDIYQAFSLAEDRMYKNKLLATKSLRNSMITSLLSTLYERSDETELHASRMVEKCKMIGEKIGLNHSELNDLELLALLHDIGKIGVPDSILNKPGKLTKEEYEVMKVHSLTGSKITSTIPSLSTISDLILHHHERWDGTGYPDGLKASDIPLCSRILSVVDAYDAMSNDRVYRKALPEEEIIQELKKNASTQFDPEIVDLFLKEELYHS